VTLVPEPDPGWRLASWGGDCTGTTACVVTMTQGRSVSATFVLAELQAQVTNHRIVYTAGNLRQLRVTVEADENVVVLMQIRRNGVTLQQRRFSVVGPDLRELRMNIAQRIGRGRATLRITFTNGAGTQKVVSHRINIPPPRTLG
jgi:phage-related protein